LGYQPARDTLVVVTLPGEIDITNADRAFDRLETTVSSGAAVVIADFTGTYFCDAAGVRRLVRIRSRAMVRGTQLRLVIPLGGLLRRVLALLEVDHLLPVYPSVGQAGVLAPPAAQDPLTLIG
jgi:anti-anti-sigma factor